jgi:TetR/AcrR family transcriptional regulator
MNDNPSRTERKEWAAEQRRERIVAIAVKLFKKNDIEKIPLEEVAKASGYTVQNLYSYFRDKEDLFAAVLLKGLNSLLSVTVKTFESSGSGIEKVLAVGDQFFVFFLKNTRYFDLYMRFEKKYYAYHKRPTRPYHGDFIVQCQKVIDQMSDMMIEAIDIGVRDGSIKTSLDPKHLMLFLWAQCIGVIQVTMMRQKYFEDIYKLTTKTFISEFKSFVRGYLS